MSILCPQSVPFPETAHTLSVISESWCKSQQTLETLEHADRTWVTDLLTVPSSMLSRYASSSSRMPRILIPVSACFVFLYFSLIELDPASVRPAFESYRVGECSVDAPATAATSNISVLPIRPPDDYTHLHDNSPFCANRLGYSYLEDLRKSRATYCADASSQVTCFHSQININDRIDSFCVGNAARVNKKGAGFQIGCEMVEPTSIESSEPSLPLDQFHRYWYETGPRNVMDMFVDFEPHIQSLPRSRESGTNLILVKREGESNLWHSLMEIMTLSMTLDVLRITPRRGTEEDGVPFLAPEDGENTQVVILDDKSDGPYFDLWRLFAKGPTVRLADLPAETKIKDIIIPLPGGSNPSWRGDWEPNDCGHSELLRTFSRRVLRHFDIKDDTESSRDTVVVTFIHRLGTRKLMGIEEHIAALQHRYTNSHASIHLVDLAAMPFEEQIRLVRNSDVLAGVHGAGLTHGLWMKERSVMVEILPEDFNHKGFRNLAGALGHSYFSTHGSLAAVDDANWQQDDVAIDQDKFNEVMDLAIKSMYNTGRLSFDVTE